MIMKKNYRKSKNNSKSKYKIFILNTIYKEEERFTEALR